MDWDSNKETIGAWVIHHGRKIAMDANGPAEFSAIDEAAKSAILLAKLGQTAQTTISRNEVGAIAVASGLNPRHELTGLLSVLEQKRLIEQSSQEVSIIGVTTRGSLSNAADIFREAKPNSYESASIGLAEIASNAPIRRCDISERIGDEYRLTTVQTSDFLDRAEEIGFVDKEGDDNNRLLFNGNLFRRGSVGKSEKVLASLSEEEQRLVVEVRDKLKDEGCLPLNHVENVLSQPLFQKLVAAGIYDLNQVTNEKGVHVYITSPSGGLYTVVPKPLDVLTFGHYSSR